MRSDACTLYWPCGPMDKASVYGTGDCRFESYQGQFFTHSSDLYGPDRKLKEPNKMHQPGIEPGSHRWQRCILPLDH
jgi:hypothetical protein